nr:hypothetical protein [uncultured Agathobaculum sp.]
MPTWEIILIIAVFIIALVVEPIRDLLISIIVSIAFGVYYIGISIMNIFTFCFKKIAKAYYRIKYNNNVDETNITQVRNDAKQIFDRIFPHVDMEDAVQVGGEFNPVSIDIDTMLNRIQTWYILIRNDCEQARKQLNRGKFDVEDFVNLLRFGLAVANTIKNNSSSAGNLSNDRHKTIESACHIIEENIPNIIEHKDSIKKGSYLIKGVIHKHKFRSQMRAHMKDTNTYIRIAIKEVDKKPYRTYSYYLNEIARVLQNNMLDCFRNIDWSVYEDMIQYLPQLTEEQAKMITDGV